jgi:hypothetical protein
VSELLRSALDADPSVRARSIGASTPTDARSVDHGGLTPMPAAGMRVSERAADDPEPVRNSSDAEASGWRHHDDDMLSVADAARVARRSARTLRRAYLSGRLTAHRDGNGRGVSIRYGDLRAWLTAGVIAPTPGAAPSLAIARANVRGRTDAVAETGNPELLRAALGQGTRRVRASAGPRPAARRSGSGRS